MIVSANLGRVIVRVVVDDHHFPVRRLKVGRVENRIEGLAQAVGAVAGTDYNADGHRPTCLADLSYLKPSPYGQAGFPSRRISSFDKRIVFS